MSDLGYLTNQFLIAMPNLLDPNFFHSVTYICEHNENGAMGIVINQPVDLTLGELITQIGTDRAPSDLFDQSVYRGGPVETERGFVLHQPIGDWDSTLPITDVIGISTSNDIIEAIAAGNGPKQCLVALGYAGWGAGQLEQEMADNAWLSGPADPEILFRTPDAERWKAAAASLGIDLDLLSGEAGHA